MMAQMMADSLIAIEKRLVGGRRTTKALFSMLALWAALAIFNASVIELSPRVENLRQIWKWFEGGVPWWVSVPVLVSLIVLLGIADAQAKRGIWRETSPKTPPDPNQ